ncbi:dual specificity mitogen-activated protein kinase kinase 4-like protein [Willisornis vidua]|uniref:mitogen-activated protein kinase kinase n=1 Tax=Willisornis vidua TaxID=1566151 RepID=A0ABQ9CW68_9PASS|nr:dual specificity mitogen-activated protein kinase kinase 4-like protein [Willisornis vidua]
MGMTGEGRLEALGNSVISKMIERIRSTVDEKEQKQLLMDLDVVMRSSDCPYIVQFYGALFREFTMEQDLPMHISTSWHLEREGLGAQCPPIPAKSSFLFSVEFSSLPTGQMLKLKVKSFCGVGIHLSPPEGSIQRSQESLMEKHVNGSSAWFGLAHILGDCWICMELMSTSFDKFYKYVYSVLDDVIPEEILGKITLATVKALNHLKENLKIIHRGEFMSFLLVYENNGKNYIKPSNILLDRNGNIKLCDFGISGQLVDSIAKTRDAGCRPYMAPERIDPSASRQGYDVRSDVWSLGITLYELATGRFPYPKWNSVFDQLTQVVKGDPPQLSNSEEREFSPSFINFVNLCLTKDESKRPKYKELLKHPFILMYEERTVDVACYVCKILDQMPATPSSPMYVD